MTLRGEKTGDTTRHIKFPEDLDQKIVALAEFHHRPVTEMVVYLLDVSLNGPRELRLMKVRGNGK